MDTTVDHALGDEWWEIKSDQGITLGLGWLNIDTDWYGNREGEISLCVNKEITGEKIGSTLLFFLEKEIKNREIPITSVVVKKKGNSNYEKVLNWFKEKKYEIEIDDEKNTYMIKRTN